MPCASSCTTSRRWGALIDAATGAGANRADSLQFTLEERGQAHSDAGQGRRRRARRQAEATAAALGVELGRIPAPVGGGPIAHPKTFARAARLVAMAEAAAAPPVEAGDVDVSATIQVTYEIK
ncbi:MAG: SIMPL domain-containing protein [Candidatus Binatia bacterium]